MKNYGLPTALEADIQKTVERNRIKAWKGEVAGPRNFIKPGIYTGEEMRRNWRPTIWDSLPSVMGGQKIERKS